MQDDGQTTPTVALSIDQYTDFEAFYRAEFAWARSLAFVLSGNTDLADDLAQESFARLYKHYPDLSNPRAYLRATMVNLHRKQTGRARRQRALTETALVIDSISQPSLDILDLIDRLPRRQRTVLILRYFEDLSEAEIANAVSCRPGTVKSLARRALARLRQELDK